MKKVSLKMKLFQLKLFSTDETQEQKIHWKNGFKLFIDGHDITVAISSQNADASSNSRFRENLRA